MMKYTAIFTLTVSALAIASCAQSGNVKEVELFPMLDTDAKLWGYVNKEGEWMIPPRFVEANHFSEGLAVVSYGYLGSAPQFFVDAEGMTALNGAQFYSASRFSEGLAGACLYTNSLPTCGFVDKQGAFAIQPQYIQVGEFSEGLAAVSGLDDERSQYYWQYINQNGEVVLSGESSLGSYTGAGKFSEGLAPISVTYSNKAGVGAYIDKEGNIVIDGSKIDLFFYFSDPNNYIFSEGVAGVCTRNWSCGYINKDGEFTIPPDSNFVSVGPFVNGLAPVYYPGPRSAKFIDRTGNQAIPIDFGSVSPFNQGLALVSIDEKFNYVNTEGDLLFD